MIPSSRGSRDGSVEKHGPTCCRRQVEHDRSEHNSCSLAEKSSSEFHQRNHRIFLSGRAELNDVDVASAQYWTRQRRSALNYQQTVSENAARQFEQTALDPPEMGGARATSTDCGPNEDCTSCRKPGFYSAAAKSQSNKCSGGKRSHESKRYHHI